MAPLKRSREAKPPVTLGGRTVQGEGAVGAQEEQEDGSGVTGR